MLYQLSSVGGVLHTNNAYYYYYYYVVDADNDVALRYCGGDR